MISRSAVSHYLERSAENHEWMKGLTHDELDELISNIKPTPSNSTQTLNIAQKVCFILGILYPGFLFHLDMGCGKTKLILELLKWYLDAGKLNMALTLVPTDEIVVGWEDEIQKWNIDLPYLLLLGSGKEKWRMLETFDRGLVFATYLGFSTMVSQKVTKQKFINGKERDITKYEPDKEDLGIIIDCFDGLIMDESTRSANHKSLTYKICRTVSLNSKVHFGLAGRLFGRDPMPVWAQFFLTDHGDSFGPTIGLFREVMFSCKKGYFGGMEYKFKKERESDLQRFLGHRSIRYDIDEVIDLPEITRDTKTCSLSDDTWTYYRRCVEDIIKAKRNYREMKNVFLKMRQISSGYIGLIDDEDGERAVIEFPENPKINLLIELINELPEDRKAVVYCEFTWSGTQICKALTKAKIKHGWLYGGTKDWDNIKKKFNEDPDYQVLVVNWKKGGYGLNLQSANYGLFYESPLSIIDREQCESRLRRQGQRWPVFITDLVVRNTVDSRILEYHRDSKNLWDAIVGNPEILTQGL